MPFGFRFLSGLAATIVVSVSLSGCGSIDGFGSDGLIKTTSSLKDLVTGDREAISASLAMQLEWREQAMDSNASFNPRKRPSSVPKDFDQQPWSRELPLIAPYEDAIFTSDFGWRRLNNKRDFHSGIDIAADVGTVIYTPVTGEVIHVKNSGTDSGLVLTDGERQHTFWHIQPHPTLKKGDEIKAGYSVGRLVDWGSRTHLHYSVHLTGPSKSHKARNDSNAMDPLTLIRRIKDAVKEE